MSSSRKQMNMALKNITMPFLREKGFTGSFPHLRRFNQDSIDLLTFQFDRNGGGFVIEIAKCSLYGMTIYFDTHIPPEKVKAWDVPPDSRQRIQPRAGSSTENWFRYDHGPVVFSGKKYEKIAKQAIYFIETQAENWWSNAEK